MNSHRVLTDSSKIKIYSAKLFLWTQCIVLHLSSETFIEQVGAFLWLFI
jgi:hypothetical protein